MHHHITKFIGEWPFDSYQSILSTAPTALLRNELLEWFTNKEAFIKFHQQPVHFKINKDLFITDL